MTELTTRTRLLLLLAAPLALLITGSAHARDAETEERTAFSDASARSAARAKLTILLEREGVPFASFQSVSGLSSENEVVEFREGGDDTAPARKIAGRLSFGNVTLERRLIPDDRLLWEWRNQVEADFPSARSDVTITLFDQAGQEVAVWSLENAWPAKVTGPSLDSDDNEVAMETIVIAHERIERIK